MEPLTSEDALIQHFNEKVLPLLRPQEDRKARKGRYTLGEFGVFFDESLAPTLPKTLVIKEHESPEDLAAAGQVMRDCLFTGPLTEAEYEHLYGFKPTVQKVKLPPALADNRTLTNEEAVEMRRILDDPDYPTHAGAPVPLANPGVLINPNNPDPENVWNEPHPVEEGAYLPPDKDFDEIAGLA